MIRFGALCLSLLPVAADALDCMRPDPVRTFQRLQEDPQRYRILIGTLSFEAPTDRPDPALERQNLEPVVARFEGSGLGLDGPVPIQTQNITVNRICVGPWCGVVQPGGPALLFARQTSDGYVVDADLCSTTIFDAPSPDTVSTLTKCLGGGACEPAPPG
jgi:hypothetical protein